MKITARIALLIIAFVSLTGIIGGGIFVHQHSGQGSGGQTLTGTTINNPTITGTITGTPTWASGQTFPSTLTINSAADASPFTKSRITVYADASNWGYLGYGADTALRIVYGKTGVGLLQIGTSSANDGTGTFTSNLSVDNAGTFASTKACAANYTRIGPNFCRLTGTTVTPTGTGTSGSCVTITAPGTAPKSVLVHIKVVVNSSNTLNATDQAQFDSYSDNVCATVIDAPLVFMQKEFVAVAALNPILQTAFTTILPVNGSGNIAVKRTDTQSTNTLTVSPVGYFD